MSENTNNNTSSAKDKIQIGIATLLLGTLVVGGAMIPQPPETSIPQPTTSVSFSQNVIEDLAIKITNHLTLRQYDDVLPYFSPSVAEALSKENLEANWLYIAGSIGKFQEIEETNYTLAGDLAHVEVRLNFDLRTVVITYSFDSNNQMAGIWFVNELLKPVAESNDIFTEEIIQVGHDSNKMNGLLTVPVGVENPPIVVLVHGSGAHDLNESIGVNRPFYDIAHGLAEHGVATLRYDKRHAVYQDELPALIYANEFTIEDEVTDDVDSIIQQIKGIDTVNSDKIFILGHSLGGMLAPKIATENEEVTGIISMAGTLRSIEDIILSQNEESIESIVGVSDEDKAALLAEVQNLITQIKSLTEDSTEMILGYPASYWYSYQTLDNENLAKNLDIPILVLQGTEDFQIFEDIDYQLWVDTIGDKENAEFKTYEGLNHLMMETSGLRNIGDYDVEGNVSSEVIEDIANFINNN